MSAVTLVHLSEGDEITAELNGLGALVVDIGPGVTLFIHKEWNPEYFAEWCKHFGLDEETAPACKDGDGSELAPQQDDTRRGITANAT